MEKILCLLTIESGVILDNLCNSLIKNFNYTLYITEEHFFYLKTKNKKFNFPFNVDKNGQENNQIPQSEYYMQKEDIKNVIHHYNNVIDIKNNMCSKYINI